MDFEKNKVSQDDLENVSGGEIIETKDGKFVILPSGVKFYDKKEDAEKAEISLNQTINIPEVPKDLNPLPKVTSPFSEAIETNNSNNTNQ